MLANCVALVDGCDHHGCIYDRFTELIGLPPLGGIGMVLALGNWTGMLWVVAVLLISSLLNVFYL